MDIHLNTNSYSDLFPFSAIEYVRIYINIKLATPHTSSGSPQNDISKGMIYLTPEVWMNRSLYFMDFTEMWSMFGILVTYYQQ